jgi:transposase InsO family protein
MDLYSRRIVGWSMNRWINPHLVIDALRMALDARQPAGALIHHSDSENVIAGSFWWSDLVNVRHNRVSGAGRPWVA